MALEVAAEFILITVIDFNGAYKKPRALEQIWPGYGSWGSFKRG